MKLSALDRHPDYSLGAGPLALAVQTLDTLTRTPSPVTWSAGQHAAACKLVADARRLLATDVLNVMASDDTDYAPLDPLPEARTERMPTLCGRLIDLDALDALMHQCRHERRAPTYADLIKLQEPQA